MNRFKPQRIEVPMIDRRALREGIIASYSLEELRTVCYDLGIEYEDLSGENKSNRVIALIEYVWRRGRLDALLDYCRQDRPLYTWPALEPDAVSAVPEPPDAGRAWQTEFGIRALRAAVVWLHSGDTQTGFFQCGFLVDPRGYILTMHVDTKMLGGREVDPDRLWSAARWNGLDFPCAPVGHNPAARVALFKIDISGGQLYNTQFSAPPSDTGHTPRADALFPAAALSTELPEVDDEVHLVGYSPGFGWLNNVGRITQLDATSENAEIPLTRVQIESRAGFAGAPYMNWRGHVIGIHYGSNVRDGVRSMIPARYGLELIAANL